jgi:hypothetical protein
MRTSRRAFSVSSGRVKRLHGAHKKAIKQASRIDRNQYAHQPKDRPFLFDFRNRCASTGDFDSIAQPSVRGRILPCSAMLGPWPKLNLRPGLSNFTGQAAKLLSRDETRRVAANIEVRAAHGASAAEMETSG